LLFEINEKGETEYGFNLNLIIDLTILWFSEIIDS